MDKKRRERIDKRKKDHEWSVQVRNKFNNVCFICGTDKNLNAHHIIPKQFIDLRWDIENGISLCAKHHKFGLYSAHKNGLWFSLQLAMKKPDTVYYLSRKLEWK